MTTGWWRGLTGFSMSTTAGLPGKWHTVRIRRWGTSMFCYKMLTLQQLYRTATLLALITIFYNIAEGVVSVWFGAEDETIALFGFGLDSFVEVISGIGIWHMIRRIGKGELEERDPFE